MMMRVGLLKMEVKVHCQKAELHHFMRFTYEWIICVCPEKEILCYKASFLNVSIMKLAFGLPVTSNFDSHPQSPNTVLLYFYLYQLTTQAQNNNKTVQSTFCLQINMVHLWEKLKLLNITLSAYHYLFLITK